MIRLELDLENVPHIVNADPNRLQQVFWNLLNNSIKFTHEGGCVTIRCATENGNAIVMVQDTGIGIDPQVLPKIFDAFEQGEKRITRQFGGLGLGLAITKRLVEMQDGTITACSAGANQGAVFKVTLPLIQEQAREAKKEPAAETRSTRRILLVEDHADTALMMRAALEVSGHKVEAVPDITQALAAAQEQHFDIILSDLGLPDGSGLDLMRELRNSGNRIKGIAVSGYGREEDVRSSKDAGFAEHLTKPVEINSLLRAVERVAGGQTTPG